jgi:malate permease and related proteins
LFEIFLNNIVPIFLIAGSGFLLGKAFQIKPRMLSQITLYLFTPCLTFQLLTTNELEIEEIVGLFGFSITIASLIAALTWLVGRMLKLERRLMAAVMLCAIFMNAGNYGIPLLGFSFGEQAQAYGALYFVSMVAVTNTIGITIASSGSMDLRRAFLNLFRFPALYAVFLAIIVHMMNWHLPLPLSRSIDILSGAAIPSMLVLLGMQLQVARWNGEYRALGLALAARMVIAPIFAFGLGHILGWQGNLLRAAVVESSMPPAVMNTLLASEFDTEPSFVTFVVLTGTLASPMTLTPLLSFLGA